MRFRTVLILVVVLGVGAWVWTSRVAASRAEAEAAAAPAADISRDQSDNFVRKLGQIASRRAASPSATPVRTEVSQTELNSWFLYQGQHLLPPGVSAPKLTMLGDNKVAGEVVVDVAQLGKLLPTSGIIDPLSYLGGKVPVHITGALRSVDGVGRFDMEAADISGLPVPKSLIQQLVSRYSRSESRPDGVNLDEGFQLPANIQQIDIAKAGQAVVVQ